MNKHWTEYVIVVILISVNPFAAGFQYAAGAVGWFLFHAVVALFCFVVFCFWTVDAVGGVA